jgi:CheY-like chemotaxis protein
LPAKYNPNTKPVEQAHIQETPLVLSTGITNSTPTQTPANKTVLMVEDSEPAIIQMRDFLEDSGYNVLSAMNGATALDILKNTQPDAIILDLIMPDIDGFDVLQQLREKKETKLTPVLVLTAKHITKEDMALLNPNNVYQLIQKGDVNKNELLNALANMIQPDEVKVEKSEVVLKPETIQTQSKQKVLIVEDNPDNMITVKAVLGDKFIIYEAIDGFEGVALAKDLKPDLILMDIALPGMDGIEAFKSIRRNRDLQHIPIIALTASAMVSDRETILAYGFDAYLVKPIDDKLFFKTINTVLYGS